MAGHALLAFILIAAVATAVGYGRKQALLLGVIGAAFAALPDIDMLYAWKELLLLFTGGVFQFVDAFWTASQVTHRGVSHSLVTAVLAGTGFSLYFASGRRLVAGLVFSSMVGGALLLSGILPAAIMGVFVLIGLTITHLVRTRTTVSPRAFLAVVLAGLASHPFGDVFTGAPPDFLYPLGITILTERIVIHADPTLNLLSIFLLELVLIWGALATYTHLTKESLYSHVHPVAMAGLLYSVAPFIIPAPTLQASYQFVFSILGTGVFTASILFLSQGTMPSRESLVTTFDLHAVKGFEPPLLTMSVTGATAITVAFTGYLLAYLLIL